MLSILIPTYNIDVSDLVHELNAQCQIEDLIYEIIIWEDASTLINKSNRKLEKLQNIKYFENENNLGRTKTRNKLANYASFSWLLFLDADVFPKSSKFIFTYFTLIAEEKQFDIVYGGIKYEENTLSNEKSLRWYYGHKKESKSAKTRNKNPHFIISQNLLIRKQTFQDLNIFEDNSYGLDNIFSGQILNNKLNVLHIENEVFHRGLECNSIFLNKSIESLRTTIKFEEKKIISKDLRPIQRLYRVVYAVKIHSLIAKLISLIENPIKKNLLGPRPSLFLFDLYRLYYYIKLKSNA